MVDNTFLSLADLWEASTIRFERETLGDILPSLPLVMRRACYPLAIESKAVAQALVHHEANTLLMAYTCKRLKALVCLTCEGSNLGDILQREELQPDSLTPVYYQRWT